MINIMSKLSDYQQIAQQIDVIILILNKSGKILSSNMLAQQYFSLPKRLFFKSNFLKLKSIEHQLIEIVQASIKNGGGHQYIDKNHNLTWSSFINPQSNHCILLGKKFFGDIQEQPNFIKDIIAHMPGNVYWKDQNGQYLGCNDNMAVMAGLNSASEIVGKTDFDLPWHDQAAVYQMHDREVIQSGNAKYWLESSQIANGSILNVISLKIPLRNNNDHIIGTLGISNQVSETQFIHELLTKNREAVIRDQEQLTFLADLSQKIMGQEFTQGSVEEYVTNLKNYYESIIACMPNNVYWLSRDNILLGCNDNVAKMFGLPREQCPGLNYQQMTDLAHWKEQGYSFQHDDNEVMRTGKAMYNVAEPLIYNHNNEPIYYMSSRVPLKDSKGNIIGVVGISTDITPLKKIQQQLEAAYENLLKETNENKSRFILDISRLMRSPLSLINGAMELLGATPLSIEQQDYLSLINAGAEKFMPLLNRFHDYVDLEDETLQVCLSKFKPHEYFQRFVKEYRQLAEAKQLQFEFYYDATIPDWLKGGTHFLSQVLDNILSNALRYTTTGKITINIKLAKDKLVIKIKDTGQGIRTELLPRLFKLFERSNNVDFTTCGLDLSISYKMMEVLGGDIQIKSEISKGSCFTVIFPVEETTPVTRPTYEYYATYLPEQKNPLHWIKSPDSLIKIFILEDEPLAHKVLQHMLKSAYNCEIISAFSVNDAKQKLTEKHDLVLTDMSLPDGTGLDFIKYYQQQYGNDTPIVAITAHVSEEEKEQITDQGVKDIIAKPINLTMIKTIVDFYVLQGGLIEEDLFS